MLEQHFGPSCATFSPCCCRNVTVENWRYDTFSAVLTACIGRPHGISRWVSRGDHGMNQRFRPLTCLFALAMLTAFSSDAVAVTRHKQPPPAKKAEAGHTRHAAHKAGEKGK